MTGLLAGFGFVVDGVGVAVAVAFGVPVAVAVGLAVGVAVAVGGPIVGSEVSGILLSSDSMSLTLGLTPLLNPVTMITVTVFPFRVRGCGTTESWLPYLVCRSFWIALCTFESICVFKRIQIDWLASTVESFPV